MEARVCGFLWLGLVYLSYRTNANRRLGARGSHSPQMPYQFSPGAIFSALYLMVIVTFVQSCGREAV